MKKILLLALLLSLLLSCIAGCSNPATTPTDASVTPTGTSSKTLSQGEKSAVSAPDVASDVLSKEEPPAPSTVVSVSKEADPMLSFAKWDETTGDDHCWEVKDLPNTPESIQPFDDLRHTLCNTRQELLSFLQDNGYSTDWANRYPDSYFETNSLLLIEAGCANPAEQFYVSDLQVKDGVLHSTVNNKWMKASAIDVLTYRIYRVEINQKVEDVKEIRHTVTKIQ